VSAGDDRLRELLRRAHRDDAPPPYGKTPQARARRPPPLVLLALALALVLAFELARPRPQPIAAERLRIEWSDPLAFLLEPPGLDVLTGVPQFGPPFAGELK
jgi:hypothetical protein